MLELYSSMFDITFTSTMYEHGLDNYLITTHYFENINKIQKIVYTSPRYITNDNKHLRPYKAIYTLDANIVDQIDYDFRYDYIAQKGRTFANNIRTNLGSNYPLYSNSKQKD